MKVKYELDKSNRIAVAYFDVKKNMSEPRTFLTDNAERKPQSCPNP